MPHTSFPGGHSRQPLGHPALYAAELDSETCPTCRALAGLAYGPGDPEAPAIPNPACTRAGGCRCLWLWRYPDARP